MIDIVVFFVFAIVMLFFMAFPAMKINEFLVKKFNFSKKVENITFLALVITLSLMVALFLKYF